MPPFAGSTALEVLHRHLAEEPQRPPSMPDPLWTVVERCLRKRPEERPSAVNLAHALRTVAAGIGAQATPEMATAAIGVAALLAPDPAPAPVPEPAGGASAPFGSGDPTQVLPHSQQAQGQGAGGGYDPNAATSYMPHTGNQGPGAGQGGPNSDPTQVMPPVPGASPQAGQSPGSGSPRARTRGRTSCAPRATATSRPRSSRSTRAMDPLRRRPQRQQPPPPPPPSAAGSAAAAVRPAAAPRPPSSRRRGTVRAAAPAAARAQAAAREPRQRSANPMRIPGLGCLKGCLFMIMIMVVAGVLIWNLHAASRVVGAGQEFLAVDRGHLRQAGEL